MSNEPTDSDQRWDNEGGSQLGELARTYAIDALAENEKTVLAFLGASILFLWDELPDDTMQKLLNVRRSQATFDKNQILSQLKRVEKQLELASPDASSTDQ